MILPVSTGDFSPEPGFSFSLAQVLVPTFTGSSRFAEWREGCRPFAKGDAESIQHQQGCHHHQHRHGIRSRGEDHRDDGNGQHGQSPLRDVMLDFKNVDFREEQHGEGQLKADAEHQRQGDGEADPFRDPNLGCQFHPLVVTQQKIEHGR